MIIGLDLDNTLICYDRVFEDAAKATGLVSQAWFGNKAQLHENLRRQRGGEEAWQYLQGAVYGRLMRTAELFPAASNFLSRCRILGISVRIVSHKTEFGHGDAGGVSLRNAALDWMEDRGFFDPGVYGLQRQDVFFESTRKAKVLRIAQLHPQYFVDDLEEVFDEPDFPADVQKILFKPGATLGYACRNWEEIANVILGDYSQAELMQLAARLYPSAAVSDCNAVKGRGNSRITKVRFSDGLKAVLKRYPDRLSDPRDRLTIEAKACEFLQRHAFIEVPRPINSDVTLNAGLYEWIDGSPITSPTKHHIDMAAGFVRKLHRLHTSPEAESMPSASAACFSGEQISIQLEHRLSLYDEAINRSVELRLFLHDRFVPAMRKIVKWSSNAWPTDQSFAGILAREHQTLSPSDFGFHNMMETGNGHLHFFDLEYFGWDDPIKLISDFLWHPGMMLSADLKRHWIEACLPIFDKDGSLIQRLRAAWPMYGLCWCLILLNEFRDHVWQRRKSASGTTMGREAIEIEQLRKARSLLDQLESQYQHFPYFGAT